MVGLSTPHHLLETLQYAYIHTYIFPILAFVRHRHKNGRHIHQARVCVFCVSGVGKSNISCWTRCSINYSRDFHWHHTESPHHLPKVPRHSIFSAPPRTIYMPHTHAHHSRALLNKLIRQTRRRIIKPLSNPIPQSLLLRRLPLPLPPRTRIHLPPKPRPGISLQIPNLIHRPGFHSPIHEPAMP